MKSIRRHMLILAATAGILMSAAASQAAFAGTGDTLEPKSPESRSDSVRPMIKAYTVGGLLRDSLFAIYARSGSFSARERAEAVALRIRTMGKDLLFNPDSLKIADDGAITDILAGETVIITVTETDADWNKTTRKELAAHYLKIIRKEVRDYRAETGILLLLKEIGLALLVIGITVGLIFLIRKLFRWTAAKIRMQKGRLIKGIKIRSYTLFDEGRQVKVVLFLNTVLKWFLIILIIYIALPILFGIFPWTENVAKVLFGYILSPLRQIGKAFWDFLPNLITIIVIVVVFYYVMKGIRFLKTEVEKGILQLPGFYADWANPTYQIVRILMYAFLIVVIFPYLPGSDSPVFKGVSVFLGFLFTFGSAGSLSNIIAGLVLTYMRLFKVGDRVKIGEVTGDVIEKSILVTRIRTIKNEIISIPNSTVMNSHTINYSSDAPEKGLIIHTTVTIGYDVPWRDMHRALIDAALKTEMILSEPSPFVLQTSLDDFFVSYQINGYVKEVNKQALIYSALHQNIQDICNERGIEILSPHYRSARDGNKTSIPEQYLPAGYKAPGFNLNLNTEINRNEDNTAH